jgi:hypothetical protein
LNVSVNTSQEAIERTAFEELETIVIFANKFSTVLESNGVYQLRQLATDSEAEPASDQEEPVGLKAIPHKSTAHKPVMFMRSGSADDLKGVALSADVAPKSDLLAMWIIKFGNKLTQVTGQRLSLVWGLRIHVNCTSPEPIVQEASIHFGNQEWAGKVNRGHLDDQLVNEAQTQLGLEGTWRVRNSITIMDVRTIEGERIEQEIERLALLR